MLRKTWKNCFTAFLGTTCLLYSPLSFAVEFANIDVIDGADPINDPPTVSIPTGQGTADFHVEAGATKGLYPVRIGVDATDDAANGIMLSYVRENGRDHLDSLGGTETLYATSAASRRGNGSFSLVGRRAGNDSLNANTLYAPASSFNANVAAAYFPFSEGWMGGTAYNASNGTVLNELVASPGLTIGLAPPANFVQDFFGTGDNLVTLPGVTDTRRQGLLFVGGAKNEDNFALSEPTADGTGFNVTLHGNAKNGSGGEVDPVSFVFIPMGTPNITMARINGRGFGPNPQPSAMISSGSAFTITSSNPGEYRLSIPGQSPSTGTLLVSPSGSNDGNDGANVDNIVTYQADGNDWVILSQDLPALNGAGQISGSRAESYFSFAFLPFDSAPTSPGAIPAIETLTNFSKQRTIGWNAKVTELVYNDAVGSMYVEVTKSTSDVTVQPLFENVGDNVFAVDGVFLAKSDGILFATISEGLDDNSGTGGQLDYGIVSVDTTFDDEWWVRTSTADPVLDNEFNVNFSTAFFGADTGFSMAQGVATDGTTAMTDVTLSGVDSLTDGVLIVNTAGNDDNFATAAPRGDGSGWDITVLDDSTTPEGGASNAVNYIFLPFDADNLIAGRVNEDGSLAASTDTNDFTLTHTVEGEYLLTIPGKTPEDGMLLLTSTGEGDSADNTLAYEPAGSSFKILGLDMVTVDEAEINGEYVDLEDTSFMFAYIDFENPVSLSTTVGLPGDYNNDGFVDAADYTVWRDNLNTSTSLPNDSTPGTVTEADYDVWVSNFGSSNTTTTAVPEPGSIVLLGLMLGLSNLRPRRIANLNR